MSSCARPWSGPTLDFLEALAGAGVLRDGAKGEGGGALMVEGDTGEGSCHIGCLGHTAGLQKRQISSREPEAVSGWAAILVAT